VGEFVDCLSRLERAGKVKIFGGSNWSPSRVDEANAYAAREQLPRFAVVSNQLSLAAWREPLWPGALSSTSPEARAWHQQRRMPLLAYSPLGRGYLARLGAADERGSSAADASAFDTPDNFQRRERARALAAERGVSVVDIALGYVLSQSFPSFAVVGPRSPEQLHSSLAGAELELSATELGFLDGLSGERVS
jgi:aryl-alcohol dehydrogenase-like predicted oxidoreductase